MKRPRIHHGDTETRRQIKRPPCLRASVVRFPGLVIATLVLLAAAPALAQPADAGTGPEKTWASCVEHVPQGAVRPMMVETFPTRGLSGYAESLVVTVTHGKGETVLPEGFRIQPSSDAHKALEEAGFVIPDPDGGAGPSIVTAKTGDATRLTIPFVPLPKEPGRSGMVLPPVPIAIARANGEYLTLCTRPHAIVVDDPINNERDPQVRQNPPPRPQREDWPLARNLTIGIPLGAALALAGVWLWRRWRSRPRIVVQPPPRLPWLVALDELSSVRRSGLLEAGRNDEYFDRVSDCVRKYLGARYGFDGLETTTDEMRALLKRVRPPVPELKRIAEFLAECDLVKFARFVPDEKDCVDTLTRGEEIVRRTIPVMMPPRGPTPEPRPPVEEASP